MPYRTGRKLGRTVYAQVGEEPSDNDAFVAVFDYINAAEVFVRIVNRVRYHNDTDVERLCEVMHDAYERAAVGAGWEAQERSRKPWSEVPEANKKTMRAAVRALLEELGR